MDEQPVAASIVSRKPPRELEIRRSRLSDAGNCIMEHKAETFPCASANLEYTNVSLGKTGQDI